MAVNHGVRKVCLKNYVHRAVTVVIWYHVVRCPPKRKTFLRDYSRAKVIYSYALKTLVACNIRRNDAVACSGITVCFIINSCTFDKADQHQHFMSRHIQQRHVMLVFRKHSLSLNLFALILFSQAFYFTTLINCNCCLINSVIRSRVQMFPVWHTKAAPNKKCCEGYIVPSMVRLMYQLKSALK